MPPEPTSASQKRLPKRTIIESIFRELWDDQAQQLRESVVTLTMVSNAIAAYNLSNVGSKPVSDRNVANFFKDFIRNKNRANKNWPELLKSKRFYAKQYTGDGGCFQFVRYKDGQTEPFEFRTFDYNAQIAEETHKIESISLPFASKKLVRKDESWLMQVLVRLRVIETHLALCSTLEITQLDLLQMSLKQKGAEIDGLFLAMQGLPPSTRELLVTCEAKMDRDDILEDQIISQVQAIARMNGVTQAKIVPMAAKLVGDSEVYVVEFQPVDKEKADELTSLTEASKKVYKLTPEIPGLKLKKKSLKLPKQKS